MTTIRAARAAGPRARVAPPDEGRHDAPMRRPARTHVVILAGGRGTRFWPVGRESRPKQLLALDGDDPRPLLRATYERTAPLCDASGPWIVASRALAKDLRRMFPRMPRERLLLEPAGRNTAAAVTWAALEVEKVDPEATCVVVPSDCHVAPDRAYRAALAAALARAAASERILTLGLRPTFPATGYGYVELGAPRAKTAAGPVHAVARFVEKPPLAAAKRYVRSGRYLWNLGTFAFRPRAYLAAARLAWPDGLAALAGLGRGRATPTKVAEAYATVPSISVDYAVMEKARDLEVLSTSFAWDDLGSWDAVARHATPDASGNVLGKDDLALDATGCLVRTDDGTTVALLGVSDLVVVRTKDALLVARKGRGEDVRSIYEALAKRGRRDLLR